MIATGLADGRFLYNTLKDKIHPLGDWRKDITYPMVYDFLDCIKSSPCAGWMSHDESLRNFTSEVYRRMCTLLTQIKIIGLLHITPKLRCYVVENLTLFNKSNCCMVEKLFLDLSYPSIFDDIKVMA